MTIKKQILLPKRSFALANDEDTFINFQLNRTISDLKTERINNIFNINQQYDIERQASLKFCIYGLVESKFANTSNLIFDVKESNDLILHLPKISQNNITGQTLSIKTFELTQGSAGMSRNLYGKTKSAYSFMFEIDRNELETQDNQIRANGQIPKTRTINFVVIDDEKKIYFIQNIPYLFYDLEGNIEKFGSQTADVDDAGTIIEIDNDFPFLYDRHWIKHYFDLPAPSYVYFPDRILNVDESITNGAFKFQIALDQKSPYGLEQATVSLNVDNTVRNPNLDYLFNSQVITWRPGEQFKEVSMFIFDDKFVESNETVSFKIENCISSLPKNEEETKITINILNEDVASELRFVNNSFSGLSTMSAVTVSYVFNKPLEVPNQSVVLYATLNSTALLGKDYILDENNPTSDEILINFNQGDISGSTTITIIDNDVYDIEKKIQLAFKNPTQNIIFSTIGLIEERQLDVPSCEITIQDSLNTQFSSFVFVNNPDKNIGAFKTLTSPNNDNQYCWSNKMPFGFGPTTNYTIMVTNEGESIIYDNKLVTSGSSVTAITVSAQALSDIVIMLPSNTEYDRPNKKYTKSKYEFRFVCPEHFTAMVNSNFGFNTVQTYNFNDIVVATEKDAGPSGSSKYYLTTKLNNFLLNYDPINDGCSIADFTLVTQAFTNSLAFIGTPQFTFAANAFIGSSIETTFEDSTIPSFCSQHLPFGFEQILPPPYEFKYLTLNLRNIYTQSKLPFTTDFNYLRTDTIGSTYQPDLERKGFLKWAISDTQTKDALTVTILNNGDIPVEISGQTYAPGEKFSVRGFEQDLNDFSITLQTNESYKMSAFTKANYIVSLENVAYYTSGGQLSGASQNFVFNSTNTLEAGSLSAVPIYNVVSEYSKMYMTHEGSPGDVTANVNCGSTFFHPHAGNLMLIDLAIRGILLTASKSGFRQAYFVSEENELIYTCPMENAVRIPFKKISNSAL